MDTEEKLKVERLMEVQQRKSYTKQNSLNIASAFNHSGEKFKEYLNKTNSKEALGYKDIHGNQYIIKAFQNSP